MDSTDDTAEAARRLGLLWGERHRAPRRGRRDLNLARIVAAGIAVADDAGAEGLSMRRVAEHLGVGTMSLYTHVPGKTELLEVMVDTVYAEIAAAPHDACADWRSRLTEAAGASLRACLAHPWLVSLPTGRAVLGPGAVAKYERELGAVADIGLSDVEMDEVVALVDGHVIAAARRRVEAERSRRDSGMSEAQWWRAHAPALAAFADADRFPLATRVGTAAGRQHRGVGAVDGGFGFGLERILDGVAALIARRR